MHPTLHDAPKRAAGAVLMIRPKRAAGAVLMIRARLHAGKHLVRTHLFMLQGVRASLQSWGSNAPGQALLKLKEHLFEPRTIALSCHSNAYRTGPALTQGTLV
eukprot:scaffold37220_cov31-Tisochrysis_lutea.AAC.2